MIKHIHIENFKCFKNFDLDLGPFNVLVGPNDSGKSTLLEAIQILEAVCRNPELQNRDIAKKGLPHFPRTSFTHGVDDEPIRIEANRSTTHGESAGTAALHYHGGGAKTQVELKDEASEVSDTVTKTSMSRQWASHAMGRLSIYRFVPSELREESQKFVTGGDPNSRTNLRRMRNSGLGFPTFLHDFLMNDRTRFFEMERRFYESFPAYDGLDVEDVGKGKETLWKLRFKTKFGQELEASEVSDGTMLYLAYLAIAYEAKGPTMLLVEEPENGIHHRSLEDVVSVLRKLAEDEDKQVILTTHSPYLLDLVEPDQVKVFSKQEDGTVEARTMSDHQEVRDMTKHFMSGTIWTELGEERIIEGAKGE